MGVISVAELLLAAVAVVASVVIYRWQRLSKRLGYAVLTNRSLLTFRSPFAVSVHHEGAVVDEARLVVMRVANTGNAPIQVSDFERNVAVTFPHCGVLSVEVTGVRPKELSPTVRAEGSMFAIEPCLLNPADVLEIQCLLDGPFVEPNVECRIVGVPSVQQVKLPRDSWGKVWRVSVSDVILVSLAAVLLLGIAMRSLFITRDVGGIAVGVFWALGVAWFWWGSVSKFRQSRLWLALPPPEGH